jgi:hypothetical protein
MLLLIFAGAGAYALGFIGYRTAVAVGGAIAALAVGSLLHQRTDQLVRYFTLWPVVTVEVFLERKLIRGRLTAFPTTLAAVIAKPQALLDLIRSSSAYGHQLLPSGLKPVRAFAGAELAAEPLKSRTAAVVNIVATDASGAEKALKFFVKIPSDRLQPYSSVALMTTYMKEPREVSVSKDMMRELEQGANWKGVSFKPLTKARPLVAESDRLWAHNLLSWEVVEHRDYEVIPDHKGITPHHARLMLTMIARFHAANWKADRRDPGVFAPYIGDRCPMAYLSYVDMIKHTTGHKWFAPLYNGCMSYFKKKVKNGSVVLVAGHNDFRPGNMMFSKSFPDRTKSGSVEDTTWFKSVMQPSDLVVLDWEAMALSPHWWDVMYCMCAGLKPAEHAKYRGPLIRAYMAELVANGVPASDLPDPSEAELHCNVMVLLMPGYCEALMQLGGAGKAWGNSQEDCDSWQSRVSAAVLLVTEDIEAIAKRLNVDKAVIVGVRESHKKYVK